MSEDKETSKNIALDVRKRFIDQNKDFIVCEPSGRFLKDLETDKIQKFKLMD